MKQLQDRWIHISDIRISDQQTRGRTAAVSFWIARSAAVASHATNTLTSSYVFSYAAAAAAAAAAAPTNPPAYLTPVSPITHTHTLLIPDAYTNVQKEGQCQLSCGLSRHMPLCFTEQARATLWLRIGTDAKAISGS